MLLSWRGVLLGTGIFLIVVLCYLVFQSRTGSQVAAVGPGQTVGINLLVLAKWTVRSPFFWLTYIVFAALGSMIVRHWRH